MVKPRSPRPIVQCVDTYCELYKDLFIEVRAYESFKYLHLGLISDLKRKSLPAIASSVELAGLKNCLSPAKQDYKCPICGQSIFNDEPLHLYHITPKSKGGKDEPKNLV